LLRKFPPEQRLSQLRRSGSGQWQRQLSKSLFFTAATTVHCRCNCSLPLFSFIFIVMKRFLSLAIFSLLLSTVHAQFFQGWGIMAGATAGRQKWYTQTTEPKQKFLLRYNAEVFAEFCDHPTFRWVTEAQYNVKGSKREINNTTTKFVNQYAAWNNYLMIRHEFFAVIPYVKVGPRLEYVFNSDQDFNKFHVTGALGAGVEFVAYGPVKFITEVWWVPDATKSYNAADFSIRQNAWELRIGLKFAARGGSCPRALTMN
jgi:hypothetical protein